MARSFIVKRICIYRPGVLNSIHITILYKKNGLTIRHKVQNHIHLLTASLSIYNKSSDEQGLILSKRQICHYHFI